ncbi:lantibiotic dehydratase family protein [Actinokineospora sp. UTMC 2448]|uniref:lantibiotic dehydratase family protein n=1 Tax=Actinokineospora sp. UTMC 2448 TaxID=2268449 RepID=UPI00216484ED|nr:lantibiotic dehydratase family protein [Actinokineospora sp. UTMC 2448]UVS78171.1 hypothetical protein Actkin_01895 [Actinokineospora sp. UTMC 2448]
MCADYLPTGPACLLRVAGVPAAALAELGAPELFDRLRAHLDAESGYRRFAKALALRVGDELIPHPELTPPLRGLAITVTRTLRRGDLVDEQACRRLAVLSVAVGMGEALAESLLRAGDRAEGLAAAERDLAAAVAAEQDRLTGLPWRIITASPALTRIMTETAPEAVAEIRARLADGQRWDAKRLRQRGDYLLRLMARSAFKPTPRGWLGQVALVDVRPGPGELRVGAHAVHTVADIQDGRRALAAADELPDAWLSMTGLHWVRGDRLCCWVDDQAGLRFVRVRRTPAVDAVRRVLGHTALRTPTVLELLAPDPDRRAVTRDFLRHLVHLGVVQVSEPPSARLDGWNERPRRADRPGFVDVYRRGVGHVSLTDAGRLGELVAQARRLAAVLAPSPPRRHPILSLVDSRPRPVTQVVAEFLEHEPPKRSARRATAWPAPQPGTSYARLCDWLAEQPGDEVDITADVLDAIGAPPAAPPAWPVDCLIRPMTDGRDVLEAVIPAGVADARFAEALGRLHGRVPQVEGYRAFLAHTAARCGAEPVEVLVPPQGERGANTVRRPRYTSTWTGDADPSAYLVERMGRYLPLRSITVRESGGRIIAEDPSGRRLWPIHHATGAAPRPWEAVLALLTAANPVAELVAPFAVGDPAMAFPDRAVRPRIVLGGGLVLAGRTALVPRDRLPAPGAPLAARVRELARLRAWTGAPRWNFVRAAGGRRPLPIDLDSVGALRVVDRLLAHPEVTELALEEMLPDPDHLPVRDEHDARFAAQLVVRLPCQADPARLAERAARALRRAEPLVVAS